ncbi:MAG: histidine kinase [Candidatus Pseudobacter hemicellulosilyticus]|uniref:Histidine kinase n=1 Tax=Candidatus Pseudobacter hemicellulosilyticus TaxID=3121375 RepID=A0AAJ6BI32_9BACT|nr:MAG: histidine kinase [Pseudobacter sp.]
MTEDNYSSEQRIETFLNNRKKRILLIVFALILLYLGSYIMDPYASYWGTYFTRPWPDMLEEWAISLIFCFLISEASIVIGKKLNRYIRWTDHPSRRLAIEAVLNLLVVMILNLSIDLSYYLLSNNPDMTIIGSKWSEEKAKGAIQWVTVSAILSLMIMAINIGNYLIVNWKDQALKAATMAQVAMEAELQALKLQIDPHFVFNNLSVLSELILEDQQLGFEYAENFSRIYRYLLVNSKKNVIPLEEELKFLHAYMFLIKHRIGKGVHFAIHVAEDSKQLYMPPLTLQLLVENALKHNKVVKSNPLHIRIYSNAGNELVVENSLLPIETSLESSGIGIRNIIRRYHLLSAKEPQIVKGPATFSVIIPLIHYDQQDTDNRR